MNILEILYNVREMFADFVKIYFVLLKKCMTFEK